MSTRAEAPLPQRVFQRLDGGEYRSGEALAADLAVTRAAIWKAVEQLRELGVALEATPNRGYRLKPGISALETTRIQERLSPANRARIESLDIEWSLESTNTRLLDAFPPAAQRATVLLAEHQWGGRGRRGRSWIAPPGGALALSVAWQFAEMPADLSAIALVVGLATRAALADQGVHDVRLKWPNDLVTGNGKLGGILIELRAESGGPAHVVIGIGINVTLDEAARAAVLASGNTADDISAHVHPAPDRNRLVAALLDRLLPMLEEFPRQGFAPHLAAWHAADALANQEVRIENAGATSRGIARGVDVHGALLVESPAGVQRFISGEVSVRAT
jgi:BirA family transcriptional regulator, biotin operon repressor / biotin---[acetyl-CoA-carboxylase] ligase